MGPTDEGVSLTALAMKSEMPELVDSLSESVSTSASMLLLVSMSASSTRRSSLGLLERRVTPLLTSVNLVPVDTRDAIKCKVRTSNLEGMCPGAHYSLL